MSTDLKAQKKALRTELKTRLAALDPATRPATALAALENLLDLSAFWEADLLLAFLSMPDEIDTAPVIDKALALGKDVAVPRISGDSIEFVLLPEDWRSWPLDRWQIPTPPANLTSLSTGQINHADCLVLVPGLAFDRQGGRLGRGKGFYDRFLATLQSERENQESTGSLVICGYCHQTQIIDEVPLSPDDQLMDEVISD